MRVLAKLTAILSSVNSGILAIGRQIAWLALILMVLIILLQVFFRYVLNNALPWPEEAARALMIWMMALIAPTGYRWGAFVSINMVVDSLPHLVRRILTLAILILATVILIVLIQQAVRQFNSGFIFRSSSLGMALAWIYLAMTVCFGLMMSVNVELILRTLGRAFGKEEDFPKPVVPMFISGN